ncbi:uncharacterized protein LOC135814564 isoform X2 [Sycon ciliatum]|uniref:uncharacterized protein LOC135814564 isoform X2 n=1 Tax=Sycon ciliatum TaxID=27933 RepID=UPI0020A9984A|eukprot:scpid64055/ scgid2807/ 
MAQLCTIGLCLLRTLLVTHVFGAAEESIRTFPIIGHGCPSWFFIEGFCLLGKECVCVQEVFDLFKSDNLAERLQPVILEVLPSLDVSQHTSGVVIHQDSTAALTALACQLCNCLIAGDKEQFTGLSPEQERLLYEVVKLDAGLDIMLTVCATHSTRVQSGLSTQADDDHQCVIPSRLASELIDWLLSCNVPSTALDTSTRPPPAATLSPCAHSHTLFFSDPSLLSSCAIRFDTLLDCYVQHLLHWTESFVRVELCDCSLSDMQPGSYHWHHAQVLSSTASANHSDDDKLTLSLCACPPSLKHWQTLVTCFKSLAHQYGPVRQQILEQLQRKSQWTQQEHGTVSPPMQCLLWKADFQNNIWEDMLSNVTLV